MSDRLALASVSEDACIERSEVERVAVGKVKRGDPNRAIAERLAAGASTRAVGAEFGLTQQQMVLLV